jgi:diguanylate cyclase (GGDEF)-like protein/PAS domain S-box-containing protein
VIVDVNEALCRITGYDRQELLGQTPRLFKSGLHSADFYQQMWDCLDREGTWSGEIVNRARDGVAQDLLETISVVRDEQGAVANYVALLSDIRQLKGQQRQLERLALYDALTGLPNRLLLAQSMQRSMADARTNGGTLAICYLDLDGFKQINDRHGHAAGDSLLQTLAQRMQEIFPSPDVMARLGGDEFVAVLHGIQAGQRQLPLVERLLQVLVEPVIWNDLALEITASIGVTFYSGASGPQEADQLLRIADQAMYEAKCQGKNRYCLVPDVAPG